MDVITWLDAQNEIHFERSQKFDVWSICRQAIFDHNDIEMGMLTAKISQQALTGISLTIILLYFQRRWCHLVSGQKPWSHKWC
jgi:hypothetical protein